MRTISTDSPNANAPQSTETGKIMEDIVLAPRTGNADLLPSLKPGLWTLLLGGARVKAKTLVGEAAEPCVATARLKTSKVCSITFQMELRVYLILIKKIKLVSVELFFYTPS